MYNDFCTLCSCWAQVPFPPTDCQTIPRSVVMTELPKRLQTVLSSLEALIKQKVNSQGAVSVVDVFATLIPVANIFVFAITQRVPFH